MDRNLSSDKKNAGFKEGRPSYLRSEISILLALLFFTGANLLYAENQSDFQISTASPFYPEVTLGMLLCGVLFVSISIVSFLLTERRRPLTVDASSRVGKSVGAIIADTIFQNKRVIVLVALIYGTIFAFLDGILIYQPTVNFASAYGVVAPAAFVETCCGPVGYIPVGLLYLPAQHFGIQLIPITILIMIVVSALVAINVALLFVSVKKTRPMKQQKGKNPLGAGRSSFLSGAVGAAFGVFAGCPTCAAAFFLSMIAGSGATAFSLAISQFQPVIILFSIPLLFASILWQARSIRIILLGCQI